MKIMLFCRFDCLSRFTHFKDHFWPAVLGRGTPLVFFQLYLKLFLTFSYEMVNLQVQTGKDGIYLLKLILVVWYFNLSSWQKCKTWSSFWPLGRWGKLTLSDQGQHKIWKINKTHFDKFQPCWTVSSSHPLMHCIKF